MSKIQLRPANKHDGPSIARLIVESADTGKVGLTVNYKINAYEANTLGLDSCGVVAENPEQGIIGVGFIKLSQRLVRGRQHPVAYLFSLCVHPSFRGRGVAKQLTDWRVRYAKQTAGPDVLLWTAIQQGNHASLQVTSTWAKSLYDGLSMLTQKTTPAAPKAHSHTLRIAQGSDLLSFTCQINSFYKDHLLYRATDVQMLEDWFKPSLFPQPHRQCYVVENAANEIVAGAKIIEDFRVRTMQVQQLPTWMRLLNRFTRMIPPSNELKGVAVSSIWFRPNHEQAVRFLWESLAHQFCGSADILTYQCDSKSPLMNIVPTKRWIPKGKLTIAASENIFGENKLLFPPG